MDYITSEQFMGQPEKVQKTLLDWWVPKVGERIYSTGISSGEYILLSESNAYESYYIVALIELADIRDFGIRKTAKNVFIPLLSETQLRHFIEEKTKYKIIAIPYNGDNDSEHYHIKFKDMKLGGKLLYEPNYDIQTDDLLQAYWQVSCKIAEEDL